MILLFSLLSPIAELFPNLYLSWWLPSNGNIDKYLRAKRFRIIAVLVVWIPILFVLSKITTLSLLSIIAILVFAAFGLRIYYFDLSLRQFTKGKSIFRAPSNIPEILYFIAFSLIGCILYSKVGEMKWLIIFAILLIFLGAKMMSTFRWEKTKNISLDVIGRIIFSIGFLLNLWNLAHIDI